MIDCIFCRIVSGDVSSEKVYEDEEILAFKDINPLAPVHLLVIPKKHLTSLEEVQPEDQALLGRILLVIQKLARDHGVHETGYRVVTNIGRDGGQIVHHLHFHLLGGKPLGNKIG